ncbi:NAD(P)/FAD-dependent oxidoreductase [Nocardioides sp. CER19]|uniref:phytoene desaturase family protein n=1 Tax=Nocardioides sp. CER19 TaxID=3038538 RepID=UPI00244C7A03|nr:NAD(P)/FAD-dependent oxidoreductase [Nocardioides sp. CER19]MDH2416719.1 NAD(P)/FAD-dependent oxidoreductase [Nocardioides sp. CER19]
MARVVVVGGGFGGLASAARLAKLGHEVTLLEGEPALGGALRPVQQDGFAWDASASTTLLPAVVRDLFRKSGRPLERELDLEPLDVVREHRFADETSVRLPGGSRAAQLAAFDELTGKRGRPQGQAWVDHVASYGEVWELLRRHVFEQRTSSPPAEVTALLRSRETLHRRLRRSFADERLRLVAAHPFEAAGHTLRDVPAWAGLTAYLEQRFGAWRPAGGMGSLAAALADRMTTRRVAVHTSTPALDLVLRGGRAVAVRTSEGEVDADAVVVATDPRRLPALAPYAGRSMPAIPPFIVHLGLSGDVPDLPAELVLHGEPTLTLRPGGRAPEGGHAWTVQVRGRLHEDVLLALARHRIDVREQVATRVDLSPRELVERWNGSPLGVQWRGRSTSRLGPVTPIPGVYAAGAHAVAGDGLPFVGLSAALVAQELATA